jgi:Ser/Thr protein kinase RdoA (MazF antagonist)
MVEPEVLWVLSAYGESPPPHQIHPLGSAGGFSGSRFWRIDTPGGPCCLQRWPQGNPSTEQAEFIHAVLRHVVQQGFGLVPAIRTTPHGTGYVDHAGYLWQLRTWIPGLADFRRCPSRVKLASAMTCLAGFHRAAESYRATVRHTLTHGGSPGIVERAQRLRHWLSGDAAELAAAIRPEPWPELAARGRRVLPLFHAQAGEVLTRLENAIGIEAPSQVCIRDVWRAHILFQGERVAGLVDFDALGWDSVATDIARLLGSLAADQEDVWHEGLAAYRSVRPLSAAELTLVRTFDRSTVLMSGMNWMEWIYRQHRQFESIQLVLERLDEIIARLVHYGRSPGQQVW